MRIVIELALRELGRLDSFGMILPAPNNANVLVSSFFWTAASEYVVYISQGEYSPQTITITTVTDVVSLI